MNDVRKIMDRVKQLQEFSVIVQVPDNFAFYGVVPYDIKIFKNGHAVVKVLAASVEEAKTKAVEYFANGSQEED
jgi:hypothetical protein